MEISGNSPRRVPQENFTESHIINPLLTKLVQRWLILVETAGSFFFCDFKDLDFAVSVYKLEKRELGQYPAILTSLLINNPSIFIFC